ncbi:hypothetical protein ACFL9T_11685 [Thermodesulfobacteriota bacterium]
MIRCTKCSAPLTYESLNREVFIPCPSCGSLTRADIFPAILKELPAGTTGELLLMDDEASCFYHPGKQAVVPCSSCGRFLCSLCDVELNGRHWCASCLNSGRKRRKIKDLEDHRTLYDSIALTLAIVPLVILPITIITAPLAIYFAIRYWKAPSSITGRTKIRLIIALLFAGSQITGWALFFFSRFSG